MTRNFDLKYMRMALELARKGQGRTTPNPCVGAVIVKNGRVIGQGYHKKAGTPHAEINAFSSAIEDVAGATMYVTLEPCHHQGRTPPCSHAVLTAGIRRVVVGMQDPNPVVDGSGLTYLENHGVEVVTGVLEKECQSLNRPFVKYITTGMPFVAMKAGISLDGRLNYLRGQSGWITGAESLQQTHRLRDQYDVIMVGSGTAIIDNPSLTTRLSGEEGRDPVRVIVDRRLQISPDSKVFSSKAGAYTWLFCGNDVDTTKVSVLEKRNTKITVVSETANGLDLHEICAALGKEGLFSVLVEGGAALHGAMLKAKLYDYAHLFQAPLFAGDAGVPLLRGFSASDRVSAPRLQEIERYQLGEDTLYQGVLRYSS